MEIQSSLHAGLQGFQNASATAHEAAANIAVQTTVSNENQSLQQAPSVTESLVALNVAEVQAQASAKVIDTADEVLGTLIDVSV
jgi:hypothetical protein